MQSGPKKLFYRARVSRAAAADAPRFFFESASLLLSSAGGVHGKVLLEPHSCVLFQTGDVTMSVEKHAPAGNNGRTRARDALQLTDVDILRTPPGARRFLPPEPVWDLIIS